MTGRAMRRGRGRVEVGRDLSEVGARALERRPACIDVLGCR
ncbi:MAG: hypothetical protein ACK559_23455 [bacterium]